MLSLTSACCVSVWGWRVVPDIFCQSFAEPQNIVPPPSLWLPHGVIPSQVCVLCRHPGGIKLTFFMLCSQAFSEISDTRMTFPRSGAGWIYTVDLIFNIVLQTEILADIRRGSNCDIWELGECYLSISDWVRNVFVFRVKWSCRTTSSILLTRFLCTKAYFIFT